MRRNFKTSTKHTKGQKPDRSALYKRFFLIFFFIFLVFHTFSTDPDAEQTGTSGIPIYFGSNIYQSNENSPNQLYILGMAHRDTFTGQNNDQSIRSQIEVYKIAEWLIRNEGVELLLPEGYFKKSEDTYDTETRSPTKEKGTYPDIETLRIKLENNTVYTNAEMMLIENHGIKSRQVEDKHLYNEVKAGLLLLADKTNDEFEALYIMSNIHYLQERRTAAMLQKIPEVIDSEFANGSIKHRKAIHTVGLDHILDIINYLEKKEIAIHSPAFVSSYNDFFAELKLLQEDFGVTIIIPRTLAENRDILKLTGLEQLIRDLDTRKISRSNTPAKCGQKAISS